MLSPDIAIWIMFLASVIIGYVTMPVMLGFTSPYIRNNSNKVISSLLMGCLMGLVEAIMHSSMMSNIKVFSYLVGFVILASMLVYLLQSQSFLTIDGFLNGMIEHHAMALVMVNPLLDKNSSSKIDKFDPRLSEVTRLANDIYTTQLNEIGIMNILLS
jgi:hypothetical protein